GVIIILNSSMHRKVYSVVLLGIIMTLLAACGSGGNNTSVEDNQESEEVTNISIGLDPYAYATVPAYLSQVILEQEGYNVEIEEAEVGILYQALSSGDIDVFVDVWRPNLHESYIEEYDDKFETAGVLFSEMPLGIAVPSYMEDINTIEDLAENADLSDNALYAIEPGSGMALNTNRRIENEDRNDMEIGTTPEFAEESPTANTLYSNMNLSIDMVEKWLVSMDEGKEPRELAEIWVEENQDIVNEWLDK